MTEDELSQALEHLFQRPGFRWKLGSPTDPEREKAVEALMCRLKPAKLGDPIPQGEEWH